MSNMIFFEGQLELYVPDDASVEDVPMSERSGERNSFIGIRKKEFKAVLMRTGLFPDKEKESVETRLRGYTALYKAEWALVNQEEVFVRIRGDYEAGLMMITGIPGRMGVSPGQEFRQYRFFLELFYLDGEETFFSISYPLDKEGDYKVLADRMLNSIEVMQKA